MLAAARPRSSMSLRKLTVNQFRMFSYTPLARKPDVQSTAIAAVTPNLPPTTKEGEKTPAQLAESLMSHLPGSDKSYTALLALTSSALLFGKEIIPYTADVLFAVPVASVIALGYAYAAPAVKEVTMKAVHEEEKIWTDSKSKAQAVLEQQVTNITGSGVTELVSITEGLFLYAREVVNMEAQVYEHEQKLAYHAKAKQVLDEWVRYESALREREQKRIAEEVIANVMKGVADAKFQEKYLEQCIGDVEMALAK